MAVDIVSELLARSDARCVIAGGVLAGGEWSFSAHLQSAVKLEAVVHGACWLIADGGAPLRLVAGDAVLLNGVDELTICSDPALVPEPVQSVLRPGTGLYSAAGTGEDVRLLGGHVDLDVSTRELFATALSPVLHVSAASAEAPVILELLQRIGEEVASARPGARFAADRHAQLLLVEILRLGLGEQATAGGPSQVALLADAELRPAVALMHDDPARSWRIEELAQAASMSRSHFALRFREAAGQPPVAYLSRLRITLAQQALRGSDTTVAALADRLGYASESSFTHAFTRLTGVSPSRYRSRP